MAGRGMPGLAIAQTRMAGRAVIESSLGYMSSRSRSQPGRLEAEVDIAAAAAAAVAVVETTPAAVHRNCIADHNWHYNQHSGSVPAFDFGKTSIAGNPPRDRIRWIALVPMLAWGQLVGRTAGSSSYCLNFVEVASAAYCLCHPEERKRWGKGCFRSLNSLGSHTKAW